MSDEIDPKNDGGSEDPVTSSTDETAAAAKDAAKDFANNAGAMFQGLNQKMQIYLVALAVTLLCSMLFSAYKVKTKFSKEMKAGMEMAESMTGQKNKTSFKSPSLAGIGKFGGTLAWLGAAGGIGILLWSVLAKRKDPWIPLALPGAAGLAALGILITRIGTGGGSSGLASVSINGTLLGWWLPLIAAVVATVVSVQRVLKA